MQKWICVPCKYVYDPAVGDLEHGIEPGTDFKDLPDDWLCPVCSLPKSVFEPYREEYHKKRTGIHPQGKQ